MYIYNLLIIIMIDIVLLTPLVSTNPMSGAMFTISQSLTIPKVTDVKYIFSLQKNPPPLPLPMQSIEKCVG